MINSTKPTEFDIMSDLGFMKMGEREYFRHRGKIAISRDCAATPNPWRVSSEIHGDLKTFGRRPRPCKFASPVSAAIAAIQAWAGK